MTEQIEPDLSVFFTAKSVAIVGASNQFGKVGYDVVHNLSQFGYPGEIIPINPKSKEIQGYKAYKKLSDYPGEIELVFISIPSKYIINIIEEMGKLGIMHVVIISAGFRETGAKGARLEQDLGDKLKHYGIRAVGPNVVGLVDTHTPLNGSFASRMPITGNLGFISQSGALITGILDWSLAEGMGFSKFVSLGNKLDLDEVDFIRYLGQDEHTHAILAYLESITYGGKFIDICKQVSQNKPIIVIKSGSSKAGARAASSHTGSMSGADTAYDAAFEKAGVIRARSVEELFDTATAFSTMPLPKGPKLCIITNAGGPGIIATDAAEFAGLELCTLSADTIEYLQSELPAAASTINPVDVLGTGAEREYGITLNAVLADANVDMVLVITTPQGMSEPAKVAHKIIELHKQFPDKPIAASYMGGVDLAEGTKILKENGIPTFAFPERGIASLLGLWKYAKIKQDLNKRLLEPEQFEANKDEVIEIFDSVINKGRVTLLGSEAIAVAKAYGILAPDTRTAFSITEALRHAEAIGYPIVMKISSPDIIHKSDIGGIAINVKTEEEVRQIFTKMMNAGRQNYPQATVMGVDIQEMSKVGRELILGVSEDPQFGHMIMIGSGGIYANYQKDVSFGITPINKIEATTMLERTRIHKILQGVRGEAPSDIDVTINTLQRVSQLVTDFPEILEMDINPLFVFEENQGINAVDVKITLDRTKILKRQEEEIS